MKIAILGDIHFKKCKEIETTYRKSVLEFVVSYLSGHGINTIIQLGDFFNDRKSIDVNLYNQVIEDYNYYFASFIDKFYCLTGNHDVYFTNTNKVNSLKHLQDVLSNFHVISYPCEIPKIGLAVPWLNSENAEEFEKIVSESSHKYCFGHFEINSFNMVKGFEETNGLSQSIFKNFEKVFSGHFHLTQDKNNISYVGSLFQNDRNDLNDIKRFMILDTESGNVEEIKIPIELFKRVVIQSEGDLDSIIIKDYKECITDFVFNIEKSVKREKFIDSIVETLPEFNIIDNSELCKEKVEMKVDNEEFTEIFTEYMKLNQILDNNRKVSLMNLFKDVYEEIITV
jgi:hypothetical protein